MTFTPDFPASLWSFQSMATALVPRIVRRVTSTGSTFFDPTTRLRSKDFVAGAIFFCYNDYRTHVGDRGVGALKQRVHGVVDLCGAQKASYEVLRRESSPVESLTAENHLNAFQLRLKTRHDVPMYTLRGYKLRGIFYGEGDIPVERQEVELPEIASGGETTVDLPFSQSGVPLHVKFDVLRPTGYSAYSGNWKP